MRPTLFIVLFAVIFAMQSVLVMQVVLPTDKPYEPVFDAILVAIFVVAWIPIFLLDGMDVVDASLPMMFGTSLLTGLFWGTVVWFCCRWIRKLVLSSNDRLNFRL